MVIENNEKLIFIENKVDSLEGNGQLEKYSKYLRQVGDKECHLCYCTKITDEKKINFPISINLDGMIFMIIIKT